MILPFIKKKKNDLQKEKYRLTLYDINQSKSLLHIILSPLKAGILCFIAFLILLILSSVIIVSTPLKNYLPGYLDIELKSKVVDTHLTLDSLVDRSLKRDIYLDNIRRILRDEISVLNKEEIPQDSIVIIPAHSLPSRSENENNFITRFEEDEKYNLSAILTKQYAEGLSFQLPVKGVISTKFSLLESNYGVRVLCAREAKIKSPLDGKVIFTDYSVENGYIIQIQHKNNFLSIFKNLGSIYKKINDNIDSGMILGITSSRNNKSQPELLYELWH